MNAVTLCTIPSDTIIPGDAISIAGILSKTLVVATRREPSGATVCRTATGGSIYLPAEQSVTLHRGEQTAAALILANAAPGTTRAAVKRGLPRSYGEQRTALYLARVLLRQGDTAGARLALTRWALARITSA